MKPVLFDAHCHIMSLSELQKATSLVSLALMSSHEKDWSVVADLAKADKRVCLGLGVHPWFAHTTTNGWSQRLELLLNENPSAFVGEIGLDKVAVTPETRVTEWETQLQVFETQLRVAARTKRVVSVHCVKAHGAMLDIVRRLAQEGDMLPPRIW
jgi:TatD DNase family protein